MRAWPLRQTMHCAWRSRDGRLRLAGAACSHLDAEREGHHCGVLVVGCTGGGGGRNTELGDALTQAHVPLEDRRYAARRRVRATRAGLVRCCHDHAGAQRHAKCCGCAPRQPPTRHPVQPRHGVGDGAAAGAVQDADSHHLCLLGHPHLQADGGARHVGACITRVGITWHACCAEKGSARDEASSWQPNKHAAVGKACVVHSSPWRATHRGRRSHPRCNRPRQSRILRGGGAGAEGVLARWACKGEHDKGSAPAQPAWAAQLFECPAPAHPLLQSASQLLAGGPGARPADRGRRGCGSRPGCGTPGVTP